MHFNYSLTNKAELLALAGVEQSPEEELCDQLEMKCFTIRDYFLRNPVLIPLYQSRIRKLIHIHNAGVFLECYQMKESKSKSLDEFDALQFKSESIESLLRKVEDYIASIKLKISSTMIPAEIAEHAWDLCRADYSYMQIFLRLTGNLSLKNVTVSAADRMDTGEYLYLVKNSKHEANQLLIKEKQRIYGLLDKLDKQHD